MYTLRLHNPITDRHETLLEMPDMSYNTARREAETFLVEHGIGHALIVEENLAGQATGYREQSSAAEAAGGGKFIPNNNAYFILRHIRDSLNLQVRSFLDLGCGAGNVLMAANKIFAPEVLTGVECDPILCGQAIARATFASENSVRIIQADVLTWEPNLNDFDLVYAYGPTVDPDASTAFWAHIKGWLNEGQYFFYQRAYCEPPEWLRPVFIPGAHYPCLYTVEK